MYKLFLSEGPDVASGLFFQQFTLNGLGIEVMPGYPG